MSCCWMIEESGWVGGLGRGRGGLNDRWVSGWDVPAGKEEEEEEEATESWGEESVGGWCCGCLFLFVFFFFPPFPPPSSLMGGGGRSWPPFSYVAISRRYRALWGGWVGGWVDGWVGGWVGGLVGRTFRFQLGLRTWTEPVGRACATVGGWVGGWVGG